MYTFIYISLFYCTKHYVAVYLCFISCSRLSVFTTLLLRHSDYLIYFLYVWHINYKFVLTWYKCLGRKTQSYVLLLIELNEKKPNHNPTTEVTGPVTCKMVGLSGLSLNNMKFHLQKFSHVDLNGAYQLGVWMARRPHKNIVFLFLFFSWNIFVIDMESAEVSNFDWPNSACKIHEFLWTHSVLYGVDFTLLHKYIALWL